MEHPIQILLPCKKIQILILICKVNAIAGFLFFRKSKTEKLAEQEHQARDQLIKSYIYDPDHSEEQTKLLLAAASSEEWTLEDLKTLASQPDLEKMQSLQHKIEQLYHVQK